MHEDPARRSAKPKRGKPERDKPEHGKAERDKPERGKAGRETLRLVRHLLGGGRPGAGRCALKALATGELAVTRPDGVSRAFAPTVVAAARSLGLVSTDEAGRQIAVLPPAVAFLKRALSAPDDAFGGQHRRVAETVVETGAGRRRLQRNLSESPLAIVARLKEKSGSPFLPLEAIEAGERLHRDFTRAQLQPRTTMAYEPRLSTRTRGGGASGGGGGGDTLADSAMAARTRVARAMEAIGPELSGIAIDVCGFEKGLETVERERQWPARSAKLLLRAALMALARHYAPPPPPRGTRRSHAWGGEGYRPSLDGRALDGRASDAPEPGSCDPRAADKPAGPA